MSDPPTLATTAVASGAVIISGATFLGAPWPVWAGGVSGVAFFMLQAIDRSALQRLMLFVPSSVGTVFGAEGVIELIGWPEKTAPVIAFGLGLVIVVMSNAWISRAGKRGFLAASFNWLVDRLVAARGGK